MRFQCKVKEDACIADIITSRCYASAAYAVVVCPSVCLSQAGIVLKLQNVGSHKQRLMIWFSDARLLGEIRTGSPHNGGVPNRGWVG